LKFKAQNFFEKEWIFDLKADTIQNVDGNENPAFD
jgi:hypothetical protein